MSRILILGAEGFLGKHLVDRLSGDHEVVGADIKSGADVATLRFWRDVGRKQRFDIVVHAASLASPKAYKAAPLACMQANLTATDLALDYCKANGTRFVYFSSSEIYGYPDIIPTPETCKGTVSCCGPRSCYDESKRMGETLCYVAHHAQGVETIVLRPFNVYGPGLTDDRIVPNFLRKIENAEKLTIYGTGEQTRTYCYVDDAIDCIEAAIFKGRAGEAYNVGNDTPEISSTDLAIKMWEQIADRGADYELVPHPDDYPADEPLRRCPDISKARQELGYAPKVSLDEGLKRYADWWFRVRPNL